MERCSVEHTYCNAVTIGLPGRLTLYRTQICIRCAVLCLVSGRTSVYLSATSRCSIKMAKHNQVNNVIDLQFSDAKILTPMHRPQWGPTARRELELQQLLDRLNYSKVATAIAATAERRRNTWETNGRRDNGRTGKSRV